MKNLNVYTQLKQKRILLAGMLAVLTLCLVQPTQSYAGVSLTSVNREVSATATAGYSTITDQHNSTTTGNFVSTAAASNSATNCVFLSICSTSTADASASQNTNLTVLADSLSVSGNIAANSYTTSYPPCYIFCSGPTPPYASATANSFVDLIFNTTSAASYAFTFGGNGYLTMQNLDTLDWVLYGNWYPFAGTIGAGNYDFNVWVDSNYNDNLDFTFTVATAPVPEPGTYVMLLTGLGLMFFTARRRKYLDV